MKNIQKYSNAGIVLIIMTMWAACDYEQVLGTASPDREEFALIDSENNVEDDDSLPLDEINNFDETDELFPEIPAEELDSLMGFCDSNEDCGENQECYGALCLDISDDAACVALRCSTNEECDSGQVCQMSDEFWIATDSCVLCGHQSVCVDPTSYEQVIEMFPTTQSYTSECPGTGEQALIRQNDGSLEMTCDATCVQGAEDTFEQCSDGIDNNSDGITDCDSETCAAFCSEDAQTLAPELTNGFGFSIGRAYALIEEAELGNAPELIVFNTWMRAAVGTTDALVPLTGGYEIINRASGSIIILNSNGFANTSELTVLDAQGSRIADANDNIYERIVDICVDNNNGFQLVDAGELFNEGSENVGCVCLADGSASC